MSRRGRPPLAARCSQIPATRVPTAVHDAAAREAIRRGVPVARVVRDALISHLQIRTRPAVSHTSE